MKRIIFTYGSIAGLIVLAAMAVSMSVSDHGVSGMMLGYLSMLIALSLVFVGTKKYRDTELGGVIRFVPAFGVGLSIALIASAFYVLGWELYMYFTNYGFAAEYSKSVISAKQAAGASTAEIAKLTTEMAEFEKQYASPLFRIPMTFAEIAPVGLIVSLISAAILKNSKAFPAKTA